MTKITVTKVIENENMITYTFSDGSEAYKNYDGSYWRVFEMRDNFGDKIEDKNEIEKRNKILADFYQVCSSVDEIVEQVKDMEEHYDAGEMPSWLVCCIRDLVYNDLFEEHFHKDARYIEMIKFNQKREDYFYNGNLEAVEQDALFRNLLNSTDCIKNAIEMCYELLNGKYNYVVRACKDRYKAVVDSIRYKDIFFQAIEEALNTPTPAPVEVEEINNDVIFQAIEEALNTPLKREKRKKESKMKKYVVEVVECYDDSDQSEMLEKIVQELIPEITITSIDKTTYEDGTHWINYTYKNAKGEEYLGIELTSSYQKGDEKELQDIIDGEKVNTKYMMDKPLVKETVKVFKDLLINTLHSDNEMWFVEYGELSEEEIKLVEKEAERFNVQDYVKFDEDDCAVTIYGGIITKFLF